MLARTHGERRCSRFPSLRLAIAAEYTAFQLGQINRKLGKLIEYLLRQLRRSNPGRLIGIVLVLVKKASYLLVQLRHVTRLAQENGMLEKLPLEVRR